MSDEGMDPPLLLHHSRLDTRANCGSSIFPIETQWCGLEISTGHKPCPKLKTLSFLHTY